MLNFGISLPNEICPISSSRRLGHVAVLSLPSDVSSMAKSSTAHRSRLGLDLLASQTVTLSTLHDSSQQRYLFLPHRPSLFCRFSIVPGQQREHFPRLLLNLLPVLSPLVVRLQAAGGFNLMAGQDSAVTMAASRTVEQKRQHSLHLGLVLIVSLTKTAPIVFGAVTALML